MQVIRCANNAWPLRSDLEPYVQDALDEIEYVAGDVSSKWGKQRADDGHPQPFHLTYVEIGNEDNFDRERGSYDKRFTQFYDAIKAKYPNLQIISTIPPIRGRENLHDLSRKPDVIDDHLYAVATATMQQSNRHNGSQYRGPDVPKIFMGEWASNGNGQGTPTPNLRSALGDAAFLGGLERNVDVVVMQCYAPLLVNVNPNARQWPTNLIGYDTLHCFGSPSFYAQKMYSQNHGDRVLPVEVSAARIDSAAAAPAPGEGRGPQGPPAPIYATAVRDDATGDVLVRVINTEGSVHPLAIKLQGVNNVAKQATVEVLTGEPTEMNSIDDPLKISPKKSTIDNAAESFTHEFPANSFSVVRLKVQ